MKNYVFDIDGTICSLTGGNYTLAKPLQDRIDKINKLYESGSHIVFFTARGMGRNNNDKQKAEEQFYSLTESQLQSWGVKYHMLFLGKPAGDIYIDDKAITDKEFFDNE